MSATSPNSYDNDSGRGAWAGGVSIFGGTVLATMGLFQFFEGLSAVLKDEVFVSTRDYVYQFDLTTWGWIHLIIGVLAFAVGAAILAGQGWALVTGIFIAALSAMTNFLFLPYYPLWALIIIGIDIAVIWALSVRLSE
jgi:hypothetical protein